MGTKQFAVERFSLTTTRTFDSVMAALDAKVGHPTMPAFTNDIEAASSVAEVEEIVQRELGESGLVMFVRFDLGAAIRKEQSPGASRSVRVLIGNPLIMKEMVTEVPDAGSYAPVTVLVDERADGVHLSYDTVASALSHYENAQALKVARDLDSKVERLLVAASS
jgi:uncharacterized protein (DUF302 family)